MHVYSFHEKGKRREKAREQTLAQRASGMSWCHRRLPSAWQRSGGRTKATVQLAIDVELKSL